MRGKIGLAGFCFHEEVVHMFVELAEVPVDFCSCSIAILGNLIFALASPDCISDMSTWSCIEERMHGVLPLPFFEEPLTCFPVDPL